MTLAAGRCPPAMIVSGLASQTYDGARRQYLEIASAAPIKDSAVVLCAVSELTE